MSIKVTFTAPGKMGIGWQPTAEGLVVGLISSDSPARGSIAIGCLLVGIDEETTEELFLEGTSTQGLVNRMAQRPVTLVLEPPKKQSTADPDAETAPSSGSPHRAARYGSPDRAATASWPPDHPLAGMAYNHEARRWETAGPSHVRRTHTSTGAPTPPTRPKPRAQPVPINTDRQRKRAKTEPPGDGTGAAMYKRPQGRAPAGYAWNERTGHWQAPDGRCLEPKVVKSKSAHGAKVKHRQPQGRPRKGQTWDFDTGRWAPSQAADADSPAPTIRQSGDDSCLAATKQPDVAAAKRDSPTTVEVENEASTELRNEMLEYNQLHKVKLQEVSIWIGYSSAVVSQWKRGLYRGNNAEIDNLVRAWMQAHRHARETGQPITAGPVRKSRRDTALPVEVPQATAPSGAEISAEHGTDAGAAAGGQAETADADLTLASSKTEADDAENEDARDAAAAETATTAKKRKRRSLSKFMRWESAEEQALLKLVDDDGARSWAKKAEALGTGRTGAGVQQHWLIMQGKKGSAQGGAAKERQEAGHTGSAKRGGAEKKQQEPSLRSSQAVGPDDLAASPSRPVAPSSPSFSASCAVAADSADGAPLGTGERATSAQLISGGDTGRSAHGDSGKNSCTGSPQAKRQNRLKSVDKYYELAAGRKPLSRGAAHVRLPAGPQATAASQVADPS